MRNSARRVSWLCFGAVALVLLVFISACKGGKSAPPTPTPTPIPAGWLITVNPVEDPEGFLRAIPAGERACLERAFGAERLLQQASQDFESPGDMAKLTGCISEETAQRITLGMILQGTGVSMQSLTCVTAQVKGVMFLDLIREQGGQQQEPAQMVPVLRAMVDCLSPQEYARTGWFTGGERLSGGYEVGEIASREQMKCLFNKLDDATIAMLFAMRGGGAALSRLEIHKVFTSCGFPETALEQQQ